MDPEKVEPAAPAEPVAPAVPEVPKPEPKTDGGIKASIRAVTERLAAETPEAKAQRIRDEQGRFAAKPAAIGGDEAKPAPTLTSVEPKAPILTATPAAAAPQSWRPNEREAWAKVPPEAQGAIARREREIASGLQDAAEHKRVAGAFREALAPYQQLLGNDPVRGTVGILQTAQALASQPPAGKAQIIANLIRGYNVPVDALVDALDGKAPQAVQTPDIASLVRQEFAQHAQTANRQQAAQSLQAFSADPKNEFFNDVRESMAGLISGGLANSLEDAYKKACSLDEGISNTLKQRAAASAATAQAAATQRARAASSSIRPSPAGPARPEPQGDDMRSSIRRAAARVAGKQ